MAPDRYVQKSGGTMINAVETRRRNVKAKTETAREPITTKVFFLFVCSPPTTELPRTIGNMGNTHGVKTVKNPATSEIIKKIIYQY